VLVCVPLPLVLNVLTTNLLADGECLLALCYRTNNSPSTPPFDLWVSVDVADTLNRKPYAYSHAVIFEDTRAVDDVQMVARDLQRNAKHVIQRDDDNKVTGQLLFRVLLYNINAPLIDYRH